MAETLATWFVEHLSGSVSREMIVFIVSLLPILELRGGIIAGFAMGMHWLPTFIIAYIGNLLPIPFILLFIRFIFRVLKKTPLHGLVEWCDQTHPQSESAGCRTNSDFCGNSRYFSGRYRKNQGGRHDGIFAEAASVGRIDCCFGTLLRKGRLPLAVRIK